jgi:poly [ADP-ribose] polymerase
MPHAFEIAPTGRAKCRGCGKAIAKSEVRFGERMPNPFGEGEATFWFHPRCGALKRPEPFLEALKSIDVELEDREDLEKAARKGTVYRRLPRLNGAERAPTGRARCRSCRGLIEKDSWRISLVFYEEGRFSPSGTIHVRCAGEYLETTEVLDRVRHFSSLGEDEIAEIAALL